MVILQYHHPLVLRMGGLMSRSFLTRSLAVSLAVCFLLIGGFASAQSIAHESGHAHHQKADHGTILCSWMCAAGQAADGVQLVSQVHFNLLALDAPPATKSFNNPPLESLPSRGPPSF
jgi:hypothetical protein